MFKNILFKELHENILDLKFIIAALLCIIIIPLGFYINKKDYENKKDNYRESVRIYFNSHKTLGDISRFGAAAFRAPSTPARIDGWTGGGVVDRARLESVCT